MESDREDGEMSDNEMEVDTKQPVTPEECTLLYKVEKTGPVVKQLNKVDAIKLEERAKRFGLNLSGNRMVTQKQIDELYENIGIEGNERHYRLDTLHLTGIDGLTTKDVFEYLEDYKPVSLEWVDGTSCNIVCHDHIAAALALLVHSREINDEDLKKMLSDRSSYHWREGMPHPKKDVILMRFATNADKKMSKRKNNEIDHRTKINNDSSEKNPWGDLCKSWGVYDHQEIFQRKLPYFPDKDDNEDEQPRKIIKPRNRNLAMRLGKRTQNVKESEESSDSDAEWNKKSKVPRMRMRADDEESKIKKKVVEPNLSDKEEFAPLSIEVVNSKHTPAKSSSSKFLSEKFKTINRGMKNVPIQSRLGVKVIPNEDEYVNDSCSDDSDYDNSTMSRVQRVESSVRKPPDVWSRLDSTPGHTSDHTDLRDRLKTKKHSKTDDLRDRLSKSKTNLRIEIDNN